MRDFKYEKFIENLNDHHRRAHFNVVINSSSVFTLLL